MAFIQLLLMQIHDKDVMNVETAISIGTQFKRLLTSDKACKMPVKCFHSSKYTINGITFYNDTSSIFHYRRSQSLIYLLLMLVIISTTTHRRHSDIDCFHTGGIIFLDNSNET